MALRTIKTRDENTVRLGRHQPGKSFFPVAGEIKPRAALGSIGNTFVNQRDPLGKGLKQQQKAHPAVTRAVTRAAAAVKPAVLPPKEAPSWKSREKSPDVEEMEVAQVASAFSKQLHIEDIDSTDADNPQLCAEYVKDIYEYMRELERRYHVEPDYMRIQTQVNTKMRAILVDWLVQVHLRFNLLQETLYLTVSVIDRYLASECVEKTRLQLVGVTAMLLASKYEEMYAPEIRDFVYITDETYSCDDIMQMERHMLRVLDYSLGTPLCLHFLRRYSRAGEATPEIHTMAKFLMELCLPQIAMLEYHPSLLAAAALYLAKQACNAGAWSPTLQHYSTYSEADILLCVCEMAHLVVTMAAAKQQAVKNKYTSEKFLRVAKAKGLFCPAVKSLAAARSK